MRQREELFPKTGCSFYFWKALEPWKVLFRALISKILMRNNSQERLKAQLRDYIRSLMDPHLQHKPLQALVVGYKNGEMWLMTGLESDGKVNLFQMSPLFERTDRKRSVPAWTLFVEVDEGNLSYIRWIPR